MNIHPHAAECPRRQDAPGGRAEQARQPRDTIPERQSYEGTGGWNDGRIGQAYDLLCKVLTERGEALYRHPLLGEVEALDDHKCASCDAPAHAKARGEA